jgi:acetolactate synthase small subunit
MSKVYKTIRGKGIDIDKIKLKNETTVAVSNMRVNARGDLLGSGNQIAAGRNQIMDRVYAVPDSSEGYSPTDSGAAVQRQAMIDTVTAPEAAPIEETPVIVAAPEPTTTSRGSLASSVSKTKNDRPSRI